MTHVHDFQIDKTRPRHKRAGRYFIVCACGEKAQGTKQRAQDGSLYWHPFTSTRPRKSPDEVRRPRALKLSDNEMKFLGERGFKTAQRFVNYCLLTLRQK